MPWSAAGQSPSHDFTTVAPCAPRRPRKHHPPTSGAGVLSPETGPGLRDSFDPQRTAEVLYRPGRSVIKGTAWFFQTPANPVTLRHQRGILRLDSTPPVTPLGEGSVPRGPSTISGACSEPRVPRLPPVYLADYRFRGSHEPEPQVQ